MRTVGWFRDGVLDENEEIQCILHGRRAEGLEEWEFVVREQNISIYNLQLEPVQVTNVQDVVMGGNC